MRSCYFRLRTSSTYPKYNYLFRSSSEPISCCLILKLWTWIFENPYFKDSILFVCLRRAFSNLIMGQLKIKNNVFLWYYLEINSILLFPLTLCEFIISSCRTQENLKFLLDTQTLNVLHRLMMVSQLWTPRVASAIIPISQVFQHHLIPAKELINCFPKIKWPSNPNPN